MNKFNKTGGNGKNVVTSMFRRELNGSQQNDYDFHPLLFGGLNLSSVVCGHLQQVNSVIFDKTGNFFITASDDNLLKIWNATNGRLVFTLRGSSTAIAVVALNNENSLLAAGSDDGWIWIWSLQTGALIRSIKIHADKLTKLAFTTTPLTVGHSGYLISSSLDGTVAFSGYSKKSGNQPIIFNDYTTVYDPVQTRPQAEVYCAAVSPGGMFLATGGKTNIVCIYYLGGKGDPQRVVKQNVHPSNVLCISWANMSLTFVTGGDENVALVWRFLDGVWTVKKLSFGSLIEGELETRRNAKVLKLAWTQSDSLLCAVLSDHTINFWIPFSEKNLLRVINWHQSTVTALQPHPIHQDLICSAGEDGRLALWDVNKANLIRQGPQIVFEHEPDQNHRVPIKACTWSPNGLCLVATDASGRVLIFTKFQTENSNFAGLPEDMFFHTDFEFLEPNSVHGGMVDMFAQLPPHLMSPPWLTNRNELLQPLELQRLVPGRENIPPDQLLLEYFQMVESSVQTQTDRYYHRIIIPDLPHGVSNANKRALQIKSDLEKETYESLDHESVPSIGISQHLDNNPGSVSN